MARSKPAKRNVRSKPDPGPGKPTTTNATAPAPGGSTKDASSVKSGGGGDKKKVETPAAETSPTPPPRPSVPRPITVTKLVGPSQSPRDPNLYSAFRLDNGVRVALNCMCSFTPAQISDCEQLFPNKSRDPGRMKTGTRSKCKRVISDYDTPRNKRSRANTKGEIIKDLNCVEMQVVEFNQKVLHVCETPEDGCNNEKPGFGFNCCGLIDTEGNNTVEGDGKPLPTPEDLVASPEPSAVVEKPPEPDSMDEDDDEKAAKTELKHNPWNRADPEETGQKGINCTGKNIICSIALTIPWGPLYDPDECPGASEICAHAIKGCEGPLSTRDEESTTFIDYFPPSKIREAINCMARKFHPTQIDINKAKIVLDIAKKKESLSDKLRAKCWNTGHTNMLKNPKRIKLLSTLAKPNHPVRRCALGGKINKSLGEIPQPTIDRAVSDYIKKNCRSQFMTVAISAPESTSRLESFVTEPFGVIGNLVPGMTTEEVHRVEGEPNPFDTPEFRKFYKVLPCPEACTKRCDEHTLILSFALPPEAWLNYRTKPLSYLSFMVGYRGFGGLYYYLKKKFWMRSMSAECPRTSLHRNQFVSLFEICINLTETGFNQYEEVLEAVFGYLNMLIHHGPQRHVFKELQRIQAIKFHSLGTNLKDLKITRNAQALSKALQIAVAEDIILASEIMIEYNGPVIKDLTGLLTAQNANIMLVSNSFDPQTMNGLEEFLVTKYAVENVREDLMHKLAGGGRSSEFKVPLRNEFIPENFCIRKEPGEDGPITTNPNAKPVHLDGDDFHDLWYLRDIRYKTRVGCLVHFVVPLAMEDIDGAVKMTLFRTIFEKLAAAALYPATVAYASHSVQLTDFGVLIKIESNADKIGQILEALAKLLTSIEEHITQEYFDVQKEEFRQKICCDLKAPAKLGRDLERVASLANAWPINEYLPVITKITRENFFEFLHEVRRDLYYMLLVVGNALPSDATMLSESIKNALTLRAVSARKIEQIKVMQWPYGKRFLKVHGLDPFNSRDFITCHYQVGLATARTIVMSKLLEPMLQQYFGTSSDLIDKGIFVLVGSTMKHNVIEIYLQAYSTGSLQQDPLQIEDLIADHLGKFFQMELCPLKPGRLCELKRNYLCSCNPRCSWFSTGSDLSFYTQGVLNLDMNYAGNDSQRRACEELKPKEIQDWYSQHFLDEYNCDCDSETRQITVIVLGNKPREVPLKPKTAEEQKAELLKKTKRDSKKNSCSSRTCAELLRGASTLDLQFDNPNSIKCDENGRLIKGRDDGRIYISNLENFKGNLFIYPSVIPE